MIHCSSTSGLCRYLARLAGSLMVAGLVHSAGAQTIIIDSATNNGGFESGAASWTVVNGTQTNKWQIDTGAVAGFSGRTSAFISQSTAAPFAHTYNITSTSVVQFYQDVTLPAGQSLATLSFKAIVQGESCCDRIRVFLAPTSLTPAAGTELSGAYQLGGDINLKGTGWVNIALNIPRALTGNASAATTRRLIFQWRNDGSVGTQPGAGIDNITLTTYCNGTTATYASNVGTTTATLNWLASPGASGYNVRYKKASDPFTVATWTTPVAVSGGATITAAITGLTAGQTEYIYQVQDAGTGVCSSWSDTSRFFTLCSPITYTALPYTEDFEGSWVNSCGTTDVPNLSWINRPYTGNPSWRRDDQGTSASWSSTNYLYSPVAYRGIHSARFHSGNVTPAGTYGYFDLYVNANVPGVKELQFATINTSGSDSLLVLLSTDGGATFTQLAGYGIVASWTKFDLTFTASSATTVIRFIGRGDNGSTDIGLDYVRVLPPCSGKPTAGTVVPVTPCPNTNFQLTAANTSAAASLTFQWQDSTTFGWSNSVGATATQAMYTTSISAPTRYRLIVTCANSGQADTTAAYTVQPAGFINCFCIPTYATGATANVITSVRLKNLTNTSSGTAPWYTDYTTQQPATLPVPSLTMGVTDTVYVRFSTNATNYSAVWVDLNHNSLFELNEYFSLGTNAGASGTAAIPVAIPLNALPGLTRLRIRGADRAAVPDTRSCGATASAYGEAEDYYVNINYPPCTGPVNGGVAIASITSICKGYTIDLTDTTHEYRRSQIGWIWQKSTDGGLSWNDMAGSDGKDTLNNVLISGASSFRVKMYCMATNGDSSFSVAADIHIKEPYKCYCYSQADGGASDYSDIGSVVINNMVNTTGGPHIYNPTAIRKRSDYTDIPNIVLSANGTCHLSIYHTQRNGSHNNARVSVFIDYNNDLRYDVNATPNSERVYSGISTEGNFYLDTILRIPDAVIPNVPTGLRIILNDDLNPASPANLGCGPYISGETEDYVVQFRRVPQSVGKLNGLSALSVYPNPSSGRFTINAVSPKAMGTMRVSIATLTGQRVFEQSYGQAGTDFTETVDLGQLAKGVYIVEFLLGDGSRNARKLVLQ